MTDLRAARSITAILREHARAVPDRDAFVFVTDPGDPGGSRSWSYRELDHRVRALAGRLQAALDPGSRVLLLHPPGMTFTAAFLGCLYAGLVAVPAPLPGNNPHSRRRIRAIARSAQPSAVLTDAAEHQAVLEWAIAEDLPAVPIIALGEDDMDGAEPRRWSDPGADHTTLALLQYTSGSTADPKGVMITHGNLIANIAACDRAFPMPDGLRYGGWLPMYHDMGLIGTLLTGLVLGRSCVSMSPDAFVKRPRLWLRMIDAYDIGFSAAPNFAYELCVRRVDPQEVARLDLSRWWHAANGSEPVQAGTVRAFAEHFAPAGLRPDAIVPGYGMAEATLVVSATSCRRPVTLKVDAEALARHELRPGPGERPARELVSCGEPAGLEVRITDPRTGDPLAEGSIGEIRLRGDSICAGYWNNRAATEAALPSGDGFLCTGDLGTLHHGELYITGRLSETAIVNGRNLYPQDIEHELRLHHTELAGLVGAAFTVPRRDDGGTGLVVTHEIKGAWTSTELSGLATGMRGTIARAFGARVDSIALLPRGGVRRTTSGKIQRGEMRELYLTGGLRSLYVDHAPGS